ncbi:hypothetical protein TNCV_1501011 [Trichonephila clavipes]|uniref:Uncharacterized protein n=1 Tax=Trichonephila clavipes TaxID=2585209 RepID=A0A8X6V8N2_TRICX|nr:hypothetical protein TNCV_1501011 [Trichonephila clavipes]
MHVTMGSLFIAWPRSRVVPLTGSHNGQGSAHRVTRDEACLANESDTLEIYERIYLRNKGVGAFINGDASIHPHSPNAKSDTSVLKRRIVPCGTFPPDEPTPIIRVNRKTGKNVTSFISHPVPMLWTGCPLSKTVLHNIGRRA